ncbi:hypothetical protein GCM10020367_40090 [Streptomyces sannanensis]|uniref:DUF1330 domain-containing protein n=1 Tax=Streptomyces sannanensis TaxID=285536 RepID=A0ABP6SFF6_9ACTN
MPAGTHARCVGRKPREHCYEGLRPPCDRTHRTPLLDGQTAPVAAPSTLDPFSGRFPVHGATVEVRQGEWPGALVIVAFPGIEEARAWYDSPACQEILPLRTDRIQGDIVLVDGLTPHYDDAASTATRLREAGR